MVLGIEASRALCHIDCTAAGRETLNLPADAALFSFMSA
jgi:hypothetical protein